MKQVLSFLVLLSMITILNGCVKKYYDNPRGSYSRGSHDWHDHDWRDRHDNDWRDRRWRRN